MGKTETLKEQAERIKDEAHREEEGAHIPPTIEEMREDHVKGDLPTIEKDYK